MISAFPKPSLTATIEQPVRKGELGKVTIAGYKPVPRYVDEPSNQPPRSMVTCTICRLRGHARSNTKFHPKRILLK